MTEPTGEQGLRELFTAENLRPTVILFTAPFILLTWKYVCSPAAYSGFAPQYGLPTGTAPAAMFHFGSCFVLMGVLPALIIKLVFRQRLSEYGLTLGKLFYFARSFLVVTPFLLLFAWCGSHSSTMMAEYPINKEAGLSASHFALHLAIYFLYYAGWEFYFRGFMQFGLTARLGLANAIMVQVLASSLLHIGKPLEETIGSIAGGFVWGLIAYRSRSVIPGMLQHTILGATLDYLILFRR